jgi:hypothetical protein
MKYYTGALFTPQNLRLQPKFNYVHYFLIYVGLNFLKDLERCSYARNFEECLQIGNILQSTEISGRGHYLFCETGPWVV